MPTVPTFAVRETDVSRTENVGTMGMNVLRRPPASSDNRVGYFSMSGKPLSYCPSDLIFRSGLDLDKIRRLYSL